MALQPSMLPRNGSSKKITVRQQTIKAFNHEIALAKTAASNGNSASDLGTINDLLGDHDIQAKQYYQIQIKALKLKVSLLKGATANTDANESTTGSATTNSNNSSSDNNPSSSISSSTSSSDHDGSDAVSSVTSAEIEQARKDLQSEGVDPSAWSDADIAQAILNAKKDGRTKVKESDMENYQN
ncbi:hypothetical protein [Lacticaseibacillus thailandensis]|uniref:hypothetical protein n=1 Tax=Lacticaseibacillus thailandensis TaxID=381741 RepID=UPI0012E1AF2E|nr:hypothetical protein [Lacticaseibacillus thailandensis]